MSRKSNINTLRKNPNQIQSNASSNDAFMTSLQFLESLKRSLKKKGILIVNQHFEAKTKTFILNINLFFTSKTLKKYKKSKKNRLRSWKKRKLFLCSLKKAADIKMPKNFTFGFQHFKILNHEIERKTLRIVNVKLKSFKKKLFSRRFPLYYDFLKLTTLLITKKIELKDYIFILGIIFRFLTKRAHSIYFAFLKKISETLVQTSTIDGIKLRMNGKLKGKLRAKSREMSYGEITTQVLTADVAFSNIHIHTLYGCFGLRIWLKYKEEKKKEEKVYVIRTKKMKI